jgi:hypothetical protein
MLMQLAALPLATPFVPFAAGERPRQPGRRQRPPPDRAGSAVTRS